MGGYAPNQYQQLQPQMMVYQPQQRPGSVLNQKNQQSQPQMMLYRPQQQLGSGELDNSALYAAEQLQNVMVEQGRVQQTQVMYQPQGNGRTGSISQATTTVERSQIRPWKMMMPPQQMVDKSRTTSPVKRNPGTIAQYPIPPQPQMMMPLQQMVERSCSATPAMRPPIQQQQNITIEQGNVNLNTHNRPTISGSSALQSLSLPEGHLNPQMPATDSPRTIPGPQILFSQMQKVMGQSNQSRTAEIPMGQQQGNVMMGGTMKFEMGGFKESVHGGDFRLVQETSERRSTSEMLQMVPQAAEKRSASKEVTIKWDGTRMGEIPNPTSLLNTGIGDLLVILYPYPSTHYVKPHLTIHYLTDLQTSLQTYSTTLQTLPNLHAALTLHIPQTLLAQLLLTTFQTAVHREYFGVLHDFFPSLPQNNVMANIIPLLSRRLNSTKDMHKSGRVETTPFSEIAIRTTRRVIEDLVGRYIHSVPVGTRDGGPLIPIRESILASIPLPVSDVKAIEMKFNFGQQSYTALATIILDPPFRILRLAFTSPNRQMYYPMIECNGYVVPAEDIFVGVGCVLGRVVVGENAVKVSGFGESLFSSWVCGSLGVEVVELVEVEEVLGRWGKERGWGCGCAQVSLGVLECLYFLRW